MKLILFAIVFSLMGCPPATVTYTSGPAGGGGPPPPPPPARVRVWDSSGWTLLGQATVNGRTDRDVIPVGRYQGRFDQLTMVVEDSEIELLDFDVIFGNGERWSPRVGHYFREGQRTRVIDLPGDDRIIQRIELMYRNLPGGGRASVAVWGRDTGRRVVVQPPPPPPPAGQLWDSRGWHMLGSATVNGRTDRDVINVGRYQGRFDVLTMVVTDSDLELLGFTVVFGNGERWSPRAIGHYFREGQRTRVIDLPGDDRIISRIEMAYRNLPGGGRARVEVWGKDTGRPRLPAPPPPGPIFDSRGWHLLGTATVNGRTDRDVIPVGRYQGRFDQLTMVVTDSDLELLSFQITFGNGEKWSPPAIGHYFREGQRTRVIDLPGDDRIISKIDMSYRNLPGGGRAKVEVWGKDTGRPRPPAPPPPGPVFDSRGWQLLGTATVNGRTDRDVIPVGRYQGRFDQLTMVVTDSDLELLSFQITFGNGEKWSPPAIGHYFREGQRTRVIDLPGDDRIISKIDMTYRNLPGGGRAKVEVWGKDTGRPRPPAPPPPGPVFDSRGWHLLGTATVNGRTDRDVIPVGRYQGRFDQLTMVVTDSDLELLSFQITFGNGEKWSPPATGHYFREGQRTRVIDLPGDDRIISKIDMSYRNLPGGGRAKVEVWGKDTGRPRPPAPLPPGPVFDSRGWHLLGSATVNGRTDRDVIPVGRYQGRFDQLTMVVTDSDLELLSFQITFGNGEKWSPPAIGHYFREGQRTRVIDLPGDDRIISKIDMSYRNLPGGGRAKVEVWGKDTGRPRPPVPPPPPPAGPQWDQKGWTKIGGATIDGARDRDIVRISSATPWAELTFVMDADAELYDVVITFGNGDKWSPPSRMQFKQGALVQRVNPPGKERRITQIEFKYGNVRGGRSVMEVWARPRK